MPILPVFIFTLLATLLLVVALTFGRTPSYRPTRRSVINLLERVLSGEAEVTEWDLFLGLPIQSDPLLEEARVQCLSIHEGLDGEQKASEGLANYLYDRKGRERIANVLERLKKAIKKEPTIREF
jgi:hypothetical protein